MKYMFASDVHGSVYYCKKMLETFLNSGAERLILLGDLLYHGPRNDLPKDYLPKEAAAMLNAHKDRIYAIRGNCDSEVDQMVLDFPMMADYGVFCLNGKTIYATHGHVFNQDHLPPLSANDVLIHGHTHVLKAERYKDFYILNPGSVSIPKEGNPPTYGLLSDHVFSIMDFDGNTVKSIELA